MSGRTNIRNHTDPYSEEHVLLRLVKVFLPQIVVGSISAVVAFSMLQSSLANTIRRVDALENDYVPKEIVTLKIDNINKTLEEFKQEQKEFNNGLQQKIELIYQRLR
jgi:hypothetical protein